MKSCDMHKHGFQFSFIGQFYYGYGAIFYNIEFNVQKIFS